MTKRNKIRILHTIRQGQIGGGETHVLDLVSQLDQARFQSEVLSFTDGEMVDRLRKLDIPCHIIPTTKPFDFFCWGKVKELLKEGEFNLVHAHGTRACSNTFWAANRLNIPLIYTVHGWSFHQGQSALVKMLRKSGERILVRKTKKNITVSESNRQQGIQELGMPNSTVIYNGVNLHKFDPVKDYSLKREDFGLHRDDIVVGFLARLTFQKDPITLLRAAAVSCPQAERLKFLVVGNGELDEEVKTERQKLGLESNVILEDFRTDVPDILKLLDIYCLPSLWEGLPIGVIEAMAMQKAIVATPVDGTKELIEHESEGLLVPAKDPRKLADAFLKLYQQPNLIKNYGSKARKKAGELFNVEVMGQKVSGVYEEVLELKTSR